MTRHSGCKNITKSSVFFSILFTIPEKLGWLTSDANFPMALRCWVFTHSMALDLALRNSLAFHKMNRKTSNSDNQASPHSQALKSGLSVLWLRNDVSLHNDAKSVSLYGKTWLTFRALIVSGEFDWERQRVALLSHPKLKWWTYLSSSKKLIDWFNCR